MGGGGGIGGGGGRLGAGGGGVMVLVVVGMLVTNFWRYIYIAWFFVDQEFTFYVWLNCWLNDDQTPGLQLFVQWVMPHSRLNKGPYDFMQDKFWPLGIVVACVCVYQCVHMSRCVNRELVRVITCDPFKPGSPNTDQRCKTIWSRSLYSFRGLALTFKVHFNSKDKISLYPVSPPCRVNTQPIQHHCSPERCDTFRNPCSKEKSYGVMWESPRPSAMP